jgi:5-methylcytosine-specific restriction endonuclease McrA
MEWDAFSTDAIEQQLVDDERMIARLRGRQMQALAELDTRQVATADGSRSLSEWVAARLDVGIESARNLTRTMRRLHDRPDLASELSAGSTTFDRIEALSRLNEDVGLMEWADIYRVRREAAKRARIEAEAEHRSASDRFLTMQPSLDESWWKLWGGLDGHSGALVDKVLTEAADRLPEIEGTTTDSSWKRATALIEALVSDDPPPANVTVFVDATDAAESNGAAGVVLEPGANVGREALQAILCDAVTEVTARDGAGRYMDYGRRVRTAPPALKRALLAETDFMCAADGCTSRRRLQIHHLKPWSEGGETNQADLVVLCWFHHQVVVHERRLEIVFHPDRRRVRFRQPERGPPRSLGS